MTGSAEKPILSNTLFRAVYENFPLGIIITSPQGTPILANQEACRLLGYTEDGLTAIDVKSILHSEDKELFQTTVQRLISKEITSFDFGEIRCISIDHKVIRVKLEAKIIVDGSNLSEFILYSIQGISKGRPENQTESSSANPLVVNSRGETELLIDRNNELLSVNQALLETEKQLSLIFNFTSDALLLLRIEQGGKFISKSANTAYLKRVDELFHNNSASMIGRDRKEFLQENGISKEMIDEEFDYYHKVLSSKQRIQYETEFQTGDDPVYLEVTIEPILDGNGDCNHLLRNVRDITPRRKAELALKESEERLRLALKAVNQGIYDVDLSTGAVKVTDEYATMLGYDPRTFRETVTFWTDKLHPDDKERAVDYYKRYIDGKIENYRTEFRLKTKSGDWMWILSNGKIVNRDANGKSLRMLGTHTDITLRKQAEQTIERTNKELKEIIDALDQSSLVSLTDIQGTILKVNKRFCEVAQYSEEELLGKNHRIINSGHHDKEFWKQFWKTIRSGEVWSGEIMNRAKDGMEYWVDTVINPIRNEMGEITHFLSIRQDITGRKIYEKLLLQSNFRLAQIEQIVDLTTDAIQASDEDGQLMYINKVASERLGIPQDDCYEFNVRDFEMLFKSEIDWKNHVEILKTVYSKTTESVNINQITRVSFPVEITCRYVIIQDKPYVITISHDITVKKNNEIALRESEARLVEAQRMARLGYWQFDLLTKNIWWSDEQYEINGILKSKPPLNQAEFINLIHPDDRALFLDSMNKVMAAAGDEVVTYRIVRPDGQVRVILGKARVSCNDVGQPIKISGVNQDISDRVMAEKALQESEQTLLKAQKVAKIGSWKLDVKNNILKWSNEVYKIFNLSPGKDLTYEDFLSYVHPEDKQHVDTSWNAALKGEQYDIIHRIIVDGKVKWVREQAELNFDEFKNLTYGFGTVQDITDQKILQEANLIFNQSQLLTGLGSWRRSFKTQESFWSDNIYNLYDLDKETTKPSLINYLEKVHPEDREFVENATGVLATNKGPFEFEHRIVTRNNKVRWLLNKGNVLCSKEGDPIEAYGIIRDITDEKRSTNELVMARKQAEDAATIKDEFLSVMSHEIRTPLNSVIGLSNLVLRRTPREDQLEIMKTLKGSADNLLRLVNDILDFNKIRAGKVELEFLPFSLTKFLQQLHASFKLSAFEKGLQFNVQSDTRIPETLIGDVTRLNQIFNNLLSNAIKFTHAGHVKFQVDLKNSTNKSCVLVFKIEDTGIGIATDKISSIFKPFHQSDRDISRKYGGTGLGLSIVSSLVEILNGKLDVNSVLGSGTVFSIELAFQTSSNGKDTLAEPQIQPNRTAPLRKKELTILYVEDVESNRFLIESLFADNHINCISVSSGVSALKFTKLKDFNLILMDIQMPGMDGYQVTEKIRNQKEGKNRSTPVIAFTAESYSEALRNKMVQHGFQDVITKPFDFDVLLEKIFSYADQKSTKTKPKFMSVAFYENAFDHNKAKLRKFKKSLVADIKRFETKLTWYEEKKDLDGMREEIHRIRPILKNLACDELLGLLNSYQEWETYHPEIKKINGKVRRITKKLLTQISKLNY